MNLNTYQQRAARTSRYDSLDPLVSMELFTGAGEVLQIFKKAYRDGRRAFTAEDLARLQDELGDTLWGVAMAAAAFGYPLQRVADYDEFDLEIAWAQGHAFAFSEALDLCIWAADVLRTAGDAQNKAKLTYLCGAFWCALKCAAALEIPFDRMAEANLEKLAARYQPAAA